MHVLLWNMKLIEFKIWCYICVWSSHLCFFSGRHKSSATLERFPGNLKAVWSPRTVNNTIWWLTMFAVLEENPAAQSNCTILSLSWKGTVPSSEKDKSFTRKRHFTEGWLATGNEKGIVSATYTTSLCKRVYSSAFRKNFNLRGHNSEVSLQNTNASFKTATIFFLYVIICSRLLWMHLKLFLHNCS